MNLNNQNKNKIDLGQLIGKLQKEDKNYSVLCKVLKTIYWVLIPIYTLMTAATYIDTREINDLLSGFFIVGSFLIFALVIRNSQKEYQNADYSLPTLVMLKKAAARYQPIRPKGLYALVAFFMMDAGFFLNSNIKWNTMIHQSIVLGVLIFGLLISLIIWYYKYKPLRDHALTIIAEIEGK
nr:hypothetical protein [uncultured Marinifilum sp.]